MRRSNSIQDASLSSDHFLDSTRNFSRKIAASAIIVVVAMLGALTISVCLIASAVASINLSNDLAAIADSKPLGEYRRDVKAFIDRTKNDEDPAERNGAVVDLCLLHNQLVNDSRFQINRQLQGVRAIAADRLKKCRRQIELEMLREKRAAGKTNGAGEPEFNLASVDNAQYPSRSRSSEIDFATCERWLIEDMQTITSVSGGPIRIWNHIGGNYGGPACDYGPDLVRLIETTINPDFWQTNGGNGVIYYYQPLRILVVAASSGVQDDLTDLLRTLRANGR